MDEQQTSTSISQWLGEILAAATLGIAITGAWLKDRLGVSSRINDVEKKITALDAKLDMLIALHVTDRATNEHPDD